MTTTRSATGAPAAERDEFTRRLVGICMLVRLVSILVAFLGLQGQPMTHPVLVCSLVLSGTGLAVLLSPTVAAFVADHPLVFVFDVLLSLAVVAVLGTGSPLVLATLSTAILAGFLFIPSIAALCAVVLVAGYLLVATVRPGYGFMVTLGVPVLYVGLVAIGGAARHAHRAQMDAQRRAGEALQSAAAVEERARLAREMHDSLGKTLYGIALGADALPRLVEKDPESARGYAKLLAEGAGRAAQEARQILVRLRADQPDRPLAEVLAAGCAAWQEETGVRCRFLADGAVDLSTAARYELLAIVGEALENVRRHADAQTVDVRLTGQPGRVVEIVVEDDGRGFVPAPDGRSPRGHYGLTGMAERAAEAGVDLEVRSTPGSGTRVAVTVPGAPATAPVVTRSSR